VTTALDSAQQQQQQQQLLMHHKRKVIALCKCSSCSGNSALYPEWTAA
jgi:hypothetical protein